MSKTGTNRGDRTLDEINKETEENCAMCAMEKYPGTPMARQGILCDKHGVAMALKTPKAAAQFIMDNTGSKESERN